MTNATDPLGNPISATSEAAQKGVADFVDGMLSYESKAVNVIAAAEAAPADALLNAYAAMIFMLSEANGAADRARPFLARAHAARAGANAREEANISFAEAWLEDDIPRALAIGAEINQAHPRDLLILKMRHYFQFNAGDFISMLRVAEEALPANEDVAQMHGIAAFAYEQCHLLSEAEGAARRALAMKTKEPWAQHALAHVMLTEGRVDEGARFLEEASVTWEGLNSFMVTHEWWHLALFYLSQGREADVLRLYDERVWGVDKTYSQDQIGAVSLFARMELAGLDVGVRWSELSDYLAVRADDVVQPFLTMQYLYGLARAERSEADALIKTVRAQGDIAAPHARAAWRDVAIPACEGLLAHARGDFVRAADFLGEALPRMAAIGGSHAQRDLFEQIWIDALVRDRQFSAAQAALELRRRHDPNGAPLNEALARLYRDLGLPRQAARAADRAKETRARLS